jgi:hypothetical protein
MVLLVLAALGILSSLALMDALQAWRGARLAEDEVRARAAAIAGVSGLLAPSDPAWLCLLPPAAPARVSLPVDDGAHATLTWWSLGRGRVRGEVEGVGRTGGRHRRIALLRPDSLPADPLTLGCPESRGFLPIPGPWLLPHPDG